MLPSLSIGREWCQIQYISWFWSVHEHTGPHTIMSLGSTGGWLGGIIICIWYLARLSISHFTTIASITEYWQGMMTDLIDLLVFIRPRTYWGPHKYEFRTIRGVAWLYNRLHLISGEVEYITLNYKCFHHWVLAGNDVRFNVLPGFDPSKNIMVPTQVWVLEPRRDTLVVESFCNLYLDILSRSHFTKSDSITEYWQGMMSVSIYFLVLSDSEHNDAHTSTRLINTEGWLGGIMIFNWYLDRLSTSHLTTSASITEYWQGMMSVSRYLLVLIGLRT